MSESLLLGIEIGGTKLQLGLGHGDGTILALDRRAIDPARGAAGILAQIPEALDSLLARSGVARAEIAALGIGFGGPVDAGRGVVTTSHQVSGWDRFPLADWARRHLGVPLAVLQNDADTAGLGEARFGAGVGLSPVLYVTIGSGIGGGLIIDGQIYRGAGAGAIEIGHLWVVDRINCDQDVLTLEDVASGWAITRAARDFAARQSRAVQEQGQRQGRGRDENANGREPWLVLRLVDGDRDRINPAVVAEAARLGDQEAAFILGKAVAAMANALNQAVTLLAPRRIILGGGVSMIGEAQWFQPIRARLDLHLFPPFRGTFDVVPAALGEAVVVQGALALAHDALASRLPPGPSGAAYP
jgi:glucokinase